MGVACLPWVEMYLLRALCVFGLLHNVSWMLTSLSFSSKDPVESAARRVELRGTPWRTVRPHATRYPDGWKSHDWPGGHVLGPRRACTKCMGSPPFG